ncbi:hypothetical protein NDI48_22290 [Microcoleus sp. AS-A8]
MNLQNADLSKSVFAETFGSILSVAYSPDGKRLAIAGESGGIRIWQVGDMKPLITCQGHTRCPLGSFTGFQSNCLPWETRGDFSEWKLRSHR